MVKLFPGQGSQFSGMGKDLYESNPRAKELFETANGILGFRITDVMFAGTDEELKATEVTQPAVFLHSVIMAMCDENSVAEMVAGHSLGEFSALVSSGAISFEDGLKLVSLRAAAMQRACEANPGTMAAVISPDVELIERTCSDTDGIVVPANYNSESQIVISGEKNAVAEASAALKESGIRKVLPLNVGGAFHSPLMEPAREELAKAIESVQFNRPGCPIYQNVDALPHTDPAEIKANLLMQLTSPVRWHQSVLNMLEAGASDFKEYGPGQVLTKMLARTMAGI